MQKNLSLLVKGATWIAATRIFISLLGFFSTIILARLLLPDDFGIVAISSSIALIVSAVTELSLAQALIQHKNPQDDHFHTAWTLNIFRSVFLALAIAILAFPMAALYDDHRLGPILLVMAGGALIGGIQNPRLVVFQRNLVFWQEFILGVGEKIAGFIVAIAVAVIFRSYWALIAGSLASQVMRAALSFALVSYRPRFSLTAWKEIVSFSVWLTLSKTVQMINWRSDPIIVGIFASPAQLGHFSVGNQIAGMPLQEGLSPVRQTLFPAFSRIKDDADRLRAAYLRAEGLLCLLAFPIGVGFAAVAEPAVVLLLGTKWLPAVPIMQALSVVFAFQIIESAAPLAMALGSTKALFARDLRTLVIRIPLIFSGIMAARTMEVGVIMGVVYGGAVSAAINALWNMQLVKSLTGIKVRQQLAIAVRPAIASAVMFGGAVTLRQFTPGTTSTLDAIITTVMLVSAGVVIYGLALLVLWVASKRPFGSETEIVGLAREFILKICSRL